MVCRRVHLSTSTSWISKTTRSWDLPLRYVIVSALEMTSCCGPKTGIQHSTCYFGFKKGCSSVLNQYNLEFGVWISKTSRSWGLCFGVQPRHDPRTTSCCEAVGNFVMQG